MKQFAIFGVGGFGRGIMPLARYQCSSFEEDYQLVFVDDNPPFAESNGCQVMTYQNWLTKPAKDRYINIAIANGFVREEIVKRCIIDGVNFFQIRSANVIQMDDVILGEGAVLCPFVTLTSNIQIGRHFHANLYSYVEHDCVIGDYVTFAPGVCCNGNVVIEDHVYIGSGAIIKQGHPDRPLVIGRGAVIGMGAVVTKNVPAGTTVLGNPARLFVKS